MKPLSESVLKNLKSPKDKILSIVTVPSALKTRGTYPTINFGFNLKASFCSTRKSFLERFSSGIRINIEPLEFLLKAQF